MRAENVALRQERDNMESKYRKVVASTAQRRKVEVSMRKFVAELCSKLPDMQLEVNASVIDNVQKVVLRTKAIALRMDTVETEYKDKIKELEKRDPTTQLKEVAKEVMGQIAHRIANTTHLPETTTKFMDGH